MQTDKSELMQVIEGILFVSGQGVEIGDIAEKLEVDKKKVEKAIEELKEKHVNDGINIITYKTSVQMCSNPKYADDIATVLNPIREKQLTKAALETAAIIAYKQPITKTEIEEIRGVNSDYAVQVLTSFKLIDVVGRKDAVGKPLLYGTTNEFLKRFELQDINDLPDYNELLERIKVLHSTENKGDGLYGSTEIISDDVLQEKDKEQISKKDEAQEMSNVINTLVKENIASKEEEANNQIIGDDDVFDGGDLL